MREQRYCHGLVPYPLVQQVAVRRRCGHIATVLQIQAPHRFRLCASGHRQFLPRVSSGECSPERYGMSRLLFQHDSQSLSGYPMSIRCVLFDAHNIPAQKATPDDHLAKRLRFLCSVHCKL